jgi:hypothetical protein
MNDGIADQSTTLVRQHQTKSSHNQQQQQQQLSKAESIVIVNDSNHSFIYLFFFAYPNLHFAVWTITTIAQMANQGNNLHICLCFLLIFTAKCVAAASDGNQDQLVVSDAQQQQPLLDSFHDEVEAWEEIRITSSFPNIWGRLARDSRAKSAQGKEELWHRFRGWSTAAGCRRKLGSTAIGWWLGTCPTWAGGGAGKGGCRTAGIGQRQTSLLQVALAQNRQSHFVNIHSKISIRLVITKVPVLDVGWGW